MLKFEILKNEFFVKNVSGKNYFYRNKKEISIVIRSTRFYRGYFRV